MSLFGNHQGTFRSSCGKQGRKGHVRKALRLNRNLVHPSPIPILMLKTLKLTSTAAICALSPCPEAATHLSRTMLGRWTLGKIGMVRRPPAGGSVEQNPHLPSHQEHFFSFLKSLRTKQPPWTNSRGLASFAWIIFTFVVFISMIKI